MFKFFTRYSMEMPQGTISNEGIRQIERYIRAQKMAMPEWAALNPNPPYPFLPGLPSDWQWQWLVEAGEYRGTFPKRAQKYWHQRGIKSPAPFLSQLGNLARSHSEHQPVYHFDFTDTIDWVAGDFGDGGSCYWGDHAGARQTLMDNGAMAMRFYYSRDSPAGIARAWLAEIHETFFVVFNGYGLAGNTTLTVARVLAAFLRVDYKVISLSNNGENSGLVWINNGLGYAVGRHEDIHSLEDYDFEWGVSLCCCRCDRAIHEYDTYTGADEGIYCESCFYDIFDNCEYCGGVHWRDDIIYTGDERYVCDYCLHTEGYRYCAECGELYRLRDLQADKEDRLLCENCRE